jgi:sugar lactone lactonase YvrE
VIKTDHMIGTVVPRKSGGMALAMEKGFYFLNDDNGETTLITNPESNIPENRFNDGKCDPAGRFWAGTMSMNGERATGSLYCLNTDLSVTKKLEGVSISNGIVWSPEKDEMYYIDTPTREIWAFDYDMSTAVISNKRVIATIPEDEGFPDGMTIDSEGMIWVAHWEGWKVSRWNPGTGTKLGEVELPAARVTSCAFGGEKLDDLYITTARTGLKEEEINNQPHAGGLFYVKTGVKGLPAYQFGG